MIEMPEFCSLGIFFYMGNHCSYTFKHSSGKAHLIGTNMVMFCGLLNEDFEKTMLIFYNV